MKCDRCDKPAVVHEVTVKGGEKNEIHLCEEHARDAGMALPGPQPLNQLLTQFVVPKTRSTQTSRRACPDCGLGFAAFQQKGIVGCPTCYQTFERHLAPLIERAQNGGLNHVGKTPRHVAGQSSAEGGVDRRAQLKTLLDELDVAVGAEEYERAARLRDRIRSFQDDDPDRAAPGTAVEDDPGA
ncbi:MAG: UvrB/UvrC motif-containing protein [Planctomycetota bacterium]|jgi:protein arginine kinase activator